MTYLFGLGNPGEKYENNRHNAGRLAVDFFAKKSESYNIKLIESKEFMNNSGKAAAKIIKSKKAAKSLVVVYDDIDLPLGTLKISYDRGSGGHNGLESVVKALKTREFIRIRIGISPASSAGKPKKPKGEDAVLKFLLSDFKKPELEILKKTFKRVAEAVEVIAEEGKEKAMNLFN
jgi:PTH1 family peptidyl-tRNA hydrolase